MDSHFEEPPRSERTRAHMGSGLLRVTLLFGSVAIALALVLAPIMERRTREASLEGIGFDYIATGSINRTKGEIYTIRRSIVEPQPVCFSEKRRRAEPC